MRSERRRELIKLEKMIAAHLEHVKLNLEKTQNLLELYINTRSMTEKEFEKLKEKHLR